MQRAKRALKAQLKLRGEAAGRAQVLRDAARDKDDEGDAAVVSTETGGKEESNGVQQRELQELEERIATASKVGVFIFLLFLR